MKKYLLLMALAAAMVLPTQAQISFGIKGGMNLTSLSFSESGAGDNVSNKTGFFVGPTVKFTLPIIGLGIDASALYDQRSGEIKATGDKLKMQSIQIPINVRYAFGLGDLASIYLFLGPQFGFNVGSKEKKFDFADWSLKTANVSGNVGLGLMLLNHLQFSANYNFAFTKMGTVDYGLGTTDVKGNAWQLALAYYF